jgi:hypothetical protein
VYSYPYPVYTEPPVVYREVVTQPAPVPAASASPTVVYYPHGRYELRGDGTTTPYQWVWIPNPPAAPPAEPAEQK